KDITSPYGYTLRGMKFDTRTSTSASLIVVRGADTFTPAGFSGAVNASTNKLNPTSGQYVLSPGGTALVPGPDSGQEDGMQLTFGPPVSAVGFDILFQSLDSQSAVSIQVLGPSGQLLLGPTSVPTSGPNGGPAGSVFVGFTASSAVIGQILIDENKRDAN